MPHRAIQSPCSNHTRERHCHFVHFRSCDCPVPPDSSTGNLSTSKAATVRCRPTHPPATCPLPKLRLSGAARLIHRQLVHFQSCDCPVPPDSSTGNLSTSKAATVRCRPTHPPATCPLPKLRLSGAARLIHRQLVHFQSCDCPVGVARVPESNCSLRFSRMPHSPRFQLRNRPNCNLPPRAISRTRV